MDHAEQLTRIISESKWRMGVLRLVSDLGLPDWWVGAGFVRNAIWDDLHGRPMTPLNDIDVVYFDPGRPEPDVDENLRIELQSRGPEKRWSVSNQARMHLRYGHDPYTSSLDGIRHWPETATSLAVSLDSKGKLEIAAPHGLDDAFDLVVRPTSAETADVVKERAETKRWAKTWPKLTFEI